MPYYIRFLSLFLLAWLSLGLVHAEGISVEKAEVRLRDDGYQLAVRSRIALNFDVQQALTHGIPLYFVSEFTVTRSRWYWLDEEVFRGEQSNKLSYNVLTRQYRLSRGALFQNFSSLDDALKVLGRQSSTVIAPDLLNKQGSYVAAVRLRLDTKQLPTLFQVNALTGKDWDLDSGWYRLVLKPGDIVANEGFAE
jgi:hypothetical protein